MPQRPFINEDAAWLVTADRYLAEAQAKWSATMSTRSARTAPRWSQRPRATTPVSDQLAIADRYIANAEECLARQAALIGQLAIRNHETRGADDKFWVIGQFLDAMRDRRQLLAGSELPPSSADSSQRLRPPQAA